MIGFTAVKQYLLTVLAIASSLLHCISAQAFPDRPLKLVVPYPPSGSADIEGSPRISKLLKLVQTMAVPSLPDTLALELTYGLGAALGQSVAFERIPAGMTGMATRQVARAAADGYTLLFAGNPTITIYPSRSQRAGVDPQRDLAAVAQIAAMPMALVGAPGNASLSIRELIARARARPGLLNLAVLGEGTTSALAGELFRRQTGVNMVPVNYNGSDAALNALTTRNVEFGIVPLTAVLPFIGGGRIAVIAIGSARRHPAIANTPTIAESGVSGFELDGWFGVFAPAPTSLAALTLLNQGINRAMAEAGWQHLLLARGLFAAAGTVDDFTALVERDTLRASRLLGATAR